jgi:hypothetical protein
MYEIWLGLNIAWELAAIYAVWAVPMAIVLFILLAIALVRRPRPGMRGVVLATAVIAATIAFFFLPDSTMASLGDLGYWVDWIVLAGLAGAVGLAAGIAAAGIFALVAPPPS